MAKDSPSATPEGPHSIDPTQNVIALVQANKEHADDLRTADERLTNVRAGHSEFVANLRADHEKEMRETNNDRLAALRLVDIATRNEDRKTADDAIRRLAEQTESLRQTLSKQVTDTADTLSKQKLESDRATEVRIAALEKASYTGAGEKAVADPAMVLLAESVAKLAAGSQERAGGSKLWAQMAVVISLLIAFGGLLLRYGGR